MSWGKNNESIRTMLFSLAVLGLAGLGLWYGASFNNTSANTTTTSAPAATFNGTGTGAIPDVGAGLCQPTQGTPLNVTFNVTGQTGAPSNVALSTTFGSPNHSWAGDITAVLIAPNGASHSVFGRVVATTATAAGDSSDLGGTYTFADSNLTPPSGGLWQAATAEASGSAPIAPGAYRTTASGGAGATNPAPATNMNAAFAGVTSPNGTWTLRLTDGCAGDTGAISAAVLTVDTAVTPTGKPNVDYDGDGKSDFSVARDTSGALSGNNEFFKAGSVREKLRLQQDSPVAQGLPSPGSTITWYNSNSSNGNFQIQSFGESATDFLVPNDYDGDSKADIAVWRPAAAGTAAFYIFQSSNSTLRTDAFGQTGDDPAITGDYDGDGKADVATYRCPAIGAGDGQCFFYYRGSLGGPSGPITYVPWGFGETFDFFVSPGDFDGDGKYDFCIQRSLGGGQGQFVLLKSTGGIEYVTWGLDSDVIVPGDYDGDGKADFCVRRTVTGNRVHYVLTRTGATFAANWGITGDVSTPGDYDGDGKTDLAIWRPNANPDLNFFYVLRSSNLSLLQFEWGNQNDFATAGWAVH